MAIMIARTAYRSFKVEILNIFDMAHPADMEALQAAHQDLWSHVADNVYGDNPHSSLDDIIFDVRNIDIDCIASAVSMSVSTGYLVNLALPRIIEVEVDNTVDDFEDGAFEENGPNAGLSKEEVDIVTVYVRDIADLPSIMAEVGSAHALEVQSAYKLAPNSKDLLEVFA